MLAAEYEAVVVDDDDTGNYRGVVKIDAVASADDGTDDTYVIGILAACEGKVYIDIGRHGIEYIGYEASFRVKESYESLAATDKLSSCDAEYEGKYEDGTDGSDVESLF